MSYAYMSPEPTPEEIMKRKTFLSIVEGMDLPKHQILTHNYEWIQKYAGVKNATHPKYPQLLEFLNSVLTL